MTLCRTIGGNECKILTITEDVSEVLNYYQLLKIFDKTTQEDREKVRMDSKSYSDCRVLPLK